MWISKKKYDELNHKIYEIETNAKRTSATCDALLSHLGLFAWRTYFTPEKTEIVDKAEYEKRLKYQEKVYADAFRWFPHF